MSHSETRRSAIGRELKIDKLRLHEIVVIKPPGSFDAAITVWVTSVTESTVTFFSGIQQWSVIAFRTPDGRLVDDLKRQVRVFRYLGHALEL